MAAAEHVNHSSSIIIIALKRTCKELQREAGKGKADILLLTKFRCFWNSFRQKNKTVKKMDMKDLIAWVILGCLMGNSEWAREGERKGGGSGCTWEFVRCGRNYRYSVQFLDGFPQGVLLYDSGGHVSRRG